MYLLCQQVGCKDQRLTLAEREDGRNRRLYPSNPVRGTDSKSLLTLAMNPNSDIGMLYFGLCGPYLII